MAHGLGNVTWDCTSNDCKNKNKLTSDWCEKCGHTWSCQQCTFVNHETQPDCVICQATGPLKPNSNSNEIKCPTCTYLQPITNGTCAMCASPLNNNNSNNNSNQFNNYGNNGNNGGFNMNYGYGGGGGGIPNANNNNNHGFGYANGNNGNGLGFQQPQQMQQQKQHQAQQQFQRFQFQQFGDSQQQQPQQLFNFQEFEQFSPSVFPNLSNSNLNLNGNGNGNVNGNSNFDYYGNFNNNNNNNNLNSNSSSKKSKHHKQSKHGKHKKHRFSKHRHSNKYNNDNQQGGKVLFKEVSEIMKNDENDVDRIKREENEVEELHKLYNYVYAIDLAHRKPKTHGQLKVNMNNVTIRNTIIAMLKYAPKKEDNKNNKDENKDDSKTNNDMNNSDKCLVCYMEYDKDSPKVYMKGDCNHSMICDACFKQHLKVKIREDDCTPWLQCPAPDCTGNIHVDLIMQHCNPSDIYHFASVFLMKHLRRNPNWVDCQTKDCNFGWIWKTTDKTKSKNLLCKACNKRRNISKKEVDKELESLFKNGLMKKCPKCKFPTMKDKGMCNIMHCGRCDIYWNWRTFEMANNSKDLKNRARNNGTLWEPGELQYQAKLQRDNLPEFIKLLERNGIKYDPNYRRGVG